MVCYVYVCVLFEYVLFECVCVCVSALMWLVLEIFLFLIWTIWHITLALLADIRNKTITIIITIFK